VFDKLVEEAIAGYDKIIGLDLSELAVDGSLHKAPCDGEGTGPNPTDRAKIGWKWSVATDLLADPHRLGHRGREPPRLHPARTDPASRRRPGLLLAILCVPNSDVDLEFWLTLSPRWCSLDFGPHLAPTLDA